MKTPKAYTDTAYEYDYDGSQSYDYDEEDSDSSVAWTYSTESIERMKMIEEIKSLQERKPDPIPLGGHIDLDAWVGEQLGKMRK